MSKIRFEQSLRALPNISLGATNESGYHHRALPTAVRQTDTRATDSRVVSFVILPRRRFKRRRYRITRFNGLQITTQFSDNIKERRDGREHYPFSLSLSLIIIKTRQIVSPARRLTYKISHPVNKLLW